MKFMIYQKLIIVSFLKITLVTSSIFLAIIFIMNIFEEITFFRDLNIGIYKPILLTALNTPSSLYEIFPFIILISTQFLFIKLIENNELYIIKSYGINNLKILGIISTVAFFIGIFLILVFYNISSKLKFLYFDIKNEYTKDNKYLAVITENGIWIKDEINGKINLIHALGIEKNFLINVNITQFDSNYDFLKSIDSQKVDITNKNWNLKKNLVRFNNFETNKIDQIVFQSNFDLEKINTLFENLSSLTIWELKNLEKDFKSLGYSTLEIKIHNQKIFSYPIFITLMSLIAGILMMNISINKSKIFYVILGILLSVLIYYVNYFSNILGENEKIPMYISVWIPLFFVSIISLIGLVRINEK